ncbi:hypothetical protein Tco_1181229 [Tanacetum coccineum]
MTYEEPTPIIIKKTKVTRYTVGPSETYTKVKLLGVEKIPRIRDNVAAIKAGLMKKRPKREMAKQRRSFCLEYNLKTWFSLRRNRIRGLLDSFSCGRKGKRGCFIDTLQEVKTLGNLSLGE